MTRFLRLSLCVATAFFLESCVYYNTFYNAKKRYRQAEEERAKSEADPENRGLKNNYLTYYLSAIRKASSILQLHPDSDLVDDSLLLMGKAYYWREEHTDAVQKFNELVDNFPESSLLVEARYWMGLSLWGREEFAEARSTLAAVGQSTGPFAWHARLALAELEFAEGNVETAIDLFNGLLEGERDKNLLARIWRDLGDAHFDTENLDASLAAYQNVLRSDPDDVTGFYARQQIGRVHELNGDFDAALRIYEGIARIKRFEDYRPRVQLMKANVFTLRGQIEDAVDAYNAIIKQYPRTEHSAEAYYQMGLIDYRTLGDSEAAMEHLKAARLERGGTTAAERAGAMEKTLFLLDKVRKQSERDGKRGLASMFDLAELYLFNLGEIDSALATYERALNRAEADDPQLAPKALFAIALIHADSLKDETEARQAFTRLLEAYPTTPYAVEARNRIDANRSDDLLAEARYLEAESLLEEGVAPEEIVTILEQVAEEYPNSFFAPQALFTTGWIYENHLKDLPHARRYYERVLNDYIGTSFAETVEEKLDGKHLDSGDPGTPPFEAFDTDTPPIVYKTAEPEETPDEEATVIVRILVGRDGVPKRTTYVNGPSKLKSTGEKLARDHRFIPARHFGSYVASWIEIPIDIREASRPFTGQIERSGPVPLPPLSYADAETKPSIVERSEVRIDEAHAHPEWIGVKFLVGEDGTAKLIEPQYRSPDLTRKVVAAAKKFKFEPGKHRGKPRDVWMETGIDILERPTKKDSKDGARPVLQVFQTDTPPVITSAADLGTPNPRFEGATAIVSALVGTDGRVEDVQYVSGPRGLDRTAKRFVTSHRFEPATYLGDPVAAWVEIPIAVDSESVPFRGRVRSSGEFSFQPLSYGEADAKPRIIRRVLLRIHGTTENTDSTEVRFLVGAKGSIKDIDLPLGLGLRDKLVAAAGKFRFAPGSHEGIPRDIWMATTIDVESTPDPSGSPPPDNEDGENIRVPTAILESVGRIDLRFSSYEWEFAPYMRDLRYRILSNLEAEDLPGGELLPVETADQIVSNASLTPDQTPDTDPRDGGVTIRFRIHRDGRADKIDHEDDDEYTELEVKPRLKSIRQAAPFSPLPEIFPDDLLEVTATFKKSRSVHFNNPNGAFITKRVGPVDITAVDVAPRLLKSAEPEFPQVARQARLEGSVRVKSLVLENGRVGETVVLEGDDVFHDAARNAARQSVFEPAVLEGRAVAVWMSHSLRFRLE